MVVIKSDEKKNISFEVEKATELEVLVGCGMLIEYLSEISGHTIAEVVKSAKNIANSQRKYKKDLAKAEAKKKGSDK